MQLWGSEVSIVVIGTTVNHSGWNKINYMLNFGQDKVLLISFKVRLPDRIISLSRRKFQSVLVSRSSSCGKLFGLFLLLTHLVLYGSKLKMSECFVKLSSTWCWRHHLKPGHASVFTLLSCVDAVFKLKIELFRPVYNHWRLTFFSAADAPCGLGGVVE